MSEREKMRWRQVDAVFAGALSRPEEERHAWVTRECGEDALLAEAVHRLLDAAADCDAFWRRAARQRSIALWETLDPGGWAAGPSEPTSEPTSEADGSEPGPPDRQERAPPPGGEGP